MIFRLIKKTAAIFFLALFVVSCEQDENPNKIPEDLPRLEELNKNYKSILTSSELGWNAVYSPNSNAGTFNILMKFHEDGTVDIQSDVNGFSKSTEKIYFDVKGAVFSELVFETFCVWHQIYDYADGEFQFRIKEINESQITLKLDNDESVLVFNKAVQADYQKIEKYQAIDSVLYTFLENNEEHLFQVLDFENSDFTTTTLFDYGRRQVYFLFAENNESKIIIGNFVYTETGIQFTSDVTINNKTLEGMTITSDTDTSLLVQNNIFNDGILYASDINFEIKGAVDLFLQNEFFVVFNNSSSLDSLTEKISTAGNEVEVQLYHNYELSSSQKFNALTFLIIEDAYSYDFYSFYINQFQKLGEDRLRMVWSGGRSSNINNELFDILKDYVTFFFNKNGFKVVPFGANFILISYSEPDKYLFVSPVN